MKTRACFPICGKSPRKSPWCFGMCRYLLIPIILASLTTKAHGYCGDGQCELGSEDSSWCPDDCKCGDSLCDFQEQALKLCPRECSSLISMIRQPSESTVAGTALVVQPAVQIFSGPGIPSFTSSTVKSIASISSHGSYEKLLECHGFNLLPIAFIFITHKNERTPFMLYPSKPNSF